MSCQRLSGAALECLVRGYLVRGCPVRGVSGIESLDSAVVSLHSSLVPWCLCIVPLCRGSAVTDQTRLGKTEADAAMRAFSVLYLYLHETQICSENCASCLINEVIPRVSCHDTQLVGWNCASCPIMRVFLAFSATKRNLMVGIACRGWKAWWNVTKRTSTRIS